MTNGRRGLLDHAKNFYAANSMPSRSDARLQQVITRPLSKHRPGIISPEKNRKDRKKKAAGEPGACSKEEEDKKNTKANPIYSKKRKEVNALENRKTIDDLGLGHIMRSKTETEALCEHLLSVKTYAILGNLAMRQAIETNSFAIYIGTTKRALKEEDLRWLTQRGAQDQRASRSGRAVYTGSRRNRPVLVRPDGTCITMGEARGTFGAKSVVISYSRLRLNETSLEDALQTELQPKRLGLERLHRHPAMGAKLAAKAAEEMRDPNFLAKTSMTCLPVAH
jgi:hypothetical protein